MNRAMWQSQKTWKIITVTCFMWIRVTEWLIVTQSAVRYGSGQKSSFSICSIWLFWTVTSFFLQVAGRKFHRDFWLPLLRNMLEVVGQEWWHQRPVGRPPTASVNINRLDTSFIKHWPGPSKLGRCCVCSVRGVTWKVCMKCLKCDVAIRVNKTCFEDYHTMKRM